MASDNIESNQDKNLPSDGISPPYSVEEIIGDISANQAHKRPLQNAESMVNRGNLKSALEIYARVLQRVKDPDSTAKIKEIIEKISVEIQKDDSLLQPKSIPNSRGATKVNFSKVLRDLTSVVSELSQTLQVQQEKTGVTPKSEAPYSPSHGQKKDESSSPPFTDSSSNQQGKNENASQSPLPFFTEEGAEPVRENTPPQAPYSPPPQGFPPPSVDSTPQENFQNNQSSPPPSFSPPQSPFPYSQPPFQPSGGVPQNPYPSYPQNLVPPEMEPPKGEGEVSDSSLPPSQPPIYNPGPYPPPMYPPMGGFVPQPPPIQPPAGEDETGSEFPQPGESQAPRPPVTANFSPPEITYPKLPDTSSPEGGIPKGILNRLEILEELYNRQDWQDLRNLPIRDRRTGKDRREEDIPVENDRRKGEDRRDEDLMEKRDEFVSDWNESVEKGEIPPKSEIDQNELAKKAPPFDSKDEPPPIKPANQEVIEGVLPKINLPDPVTLSYDSFRDAPKRSMSIDKSIGEEPPEEGLKPADILFPTEKDAQVHEIFKINLPNPKDTTVRNLEMEDDDDRFTDREINIIDAPPSEEKIEEAMENRPEVSIPEIGAESREAPEAERIMHGILELKPPEVDDAPFLTLTFDFTKIPHSFRLSKNYSVMEYSYYKYKPMLMKAQEFARRKMLKNALNYYRVIRSQNIPPELRMMINRNITDITEFLEKFMMSKGG